MAVFLVMGFEDGSLSYLEVFSIPKYLNYPMLKSTVDAMLVADGREELIVPIV